MPPTAWAVLVETLRRSCHLNKLFGVNLAQYDNTLPDSVVRDNNSFGNEAVLKYYRAVADETASSTLAFHVMLVGPPGGGKTTLCHALGGTRAPPPTASPDGIVTGACLFLR